MAMIHGPMAGMRYYACKGKESTAVMPANFEKHVTPKPTIAPPTHEQAMQRLAAANAVLKAAQQAKAAASDRLAAAQRDDYAATQELDNASAAVKSAEEVCEATKPKSSHPPHGHAAAGGGGGVVGGPATAAPSAARVSKEDIKICKDHGARTETAEQTSWILADIKVTESKKGGDAVGEVLNVANNPSGGGFANLVFEGGDLEKGRTFTGVICSIKITDRAHPFAFILASVGEKRGSVYVDWDPACGIEQGQVVTFEIQNKGRVKAVNMQVIEGRLLKKHLKKAPKPKKNDREGSPPVARPSAGGVGAPHAKPN